MQSQEHNSFISSIKAHAILPEWGWIPKSKLTKLVCESKKHQVLGEVMSGKRQPFQHQQELMKTIGGFLDTHKIGQPGLMISYQTPTGSGKTSSMLLLQDYLRKQYPGYTLVIGSPATLMSRSIHEMEAQYDSNYWSAFLAENGEYRVFRPFSSMKNALRARVKWQGIIREDDKNFMGEKTTKDEDIKIKRHPLLSQQFSQEDRFRKKADDAVPNVILSDIFAIRKLLQELHQKDAPDKFPGWIRLDSMILFIDEPNMGIINPVIQNCIQEILQLKPLVTVLASATLGDWDTIPEWWRGAPGKLHIISGSAYEQPCLEMLRVDDEISRIHQLTPLDCCNSPKQLGENMRSLNTRQHAAILRYFTPEQICQLTGMEYSKTGTNISDLRKNHLLPLLKNPSENILNVLKPDKTGTPYSRLRSALSKTGMTLIASMNPHKTAMELCSFKSEEEYFAAKHEMQNRIRNAISAEKKRQKLIDRLANSKNSRDDGIEADDMPPPIRIKIGRTELFTDELTAILEDNDIDTLLFLENGIVISTASSNNTARSLFQRAILSLPENILEATDRRPPIYCLITDYSGIFGIDCVGIKRVIILDDLAELLSQDDIIQATGRIRNNGQILMISTNTICKLFGFQTNDWNGMIDDTFAYHLNTMPNNTINEQKAILRALNTRSFAGTVFTPEEIAFKLFLSFATRPDWRKFSRLWSTGYFNEHSVFPDVENCRSDLYLKMFHSKLHQFTEPLNCLVYMYKNMDFDLEDTQAWLRDNIPSEKLRGFKEFMDFVEDEEDGDD